VAKTERASHHRPKQRATAVLPPSPLRIFISYARKDARPLALRLQHSLGTIGHSAWLDTSEITGGASWSQDIERAIEDCAIVLALLSERSFSSEICRAEQLRALRKGKRVIPLLAYAQVERPLYLEHLNYRDFSDTNRYNEAFQTLLADIANGQAVPLPEKHRHTYVTAPPPPINFIPRPEEMEQLHHTIIGDGTSRQIALTALEGMGGIGKSVLAAALCQDEVIQAAFPDGVIWVTLGREPGNLVSQMTEVGRALGDTREAYDTPEASMNRLRTALQDKAVLLILDDVWDARHIEPFRTEAPRCRTLFTTRDGAIALWALKRSN
jgi:TIR domain-containing protein/NB-ARC domain-containing protein